MLAPWSGSVHDGSTRGRSRQRRKPESTYGSPSSPNPYLRHHHARAECDGQLRVGCSGFTHRHANRSSSWPGNVVETNANSVSGSDAHTTNLMCLASTL